MRLKNNSTLLFIGDSITDCGRGRPVGKNDGLGSGYVTLVNSFLSATHPAANIHILNTGIGGNRVTDLQGRWQTDAVGLQPDYLSIMIGINDVWRHFDNHDMDQVDKDTYTRILRELIESMHDKVKGLFLLSPYMIECDKTVPMRRMMDEYIAIMAQLATEYHATYVDVQAAFDEYLKVKSFDTLAADQIHPNLTGHAIIARAFLKAIELDG